MFQWLRNLVSGGELAKANATLRRAQAAYLDAHAMEIRARYDNALTTDENRRNFWTADALSAKSANSYQVRRTLRMRSRNEVANNPYLFGVTSNNADDLIGTGPTLQLRTPSEKYNRTVEESWGEWCDEVGFVEKVRTLKLAKGIDGEGFWVFKTVNDLDHPVKLYPVDMEADQVTSPAPVKLEELWVDGLVLHPITGRPVAYTVLKHHPGDFFFGPDFNPLAADKIAARYVVHWFQKFRPGQVRGIPVFTSSLDLFAELRAFRRAVLGAAQIAANFAAVLETTLPAGLDGEPVAPFKSVPIDRGMMTALPANMKMSQFDAKQPQTSYEMFQEKCLGEACRPLSYPLNLALGTSQKFNFSSAKLDHLNYRAGLTVERADCEAVALNRAFSLFYEEGVLAGAFPAFDGMKLPPREWHWPGFEPLDAKTDADADHARLANGTETWREFWAKRGRDWKDVMKQQADELAEVEKLGLKFGDPAKTTVTESVSTDEDGNPVEKPVSEKPAAKDAPKPEKKEPQPAGAGKGQAVKKSAADVQNTALNGAQVTSLVGVCDKLVTKQYTGPATKAIITGAFPGFDEGLTNTIVRELENHEPPAPANDATPADKEAERVA